jgi:hypothetical protein
MTTEEVGQMLSEWVIVTRDRDARVRAAAARITKHRVDQLTGIGRSTIDPMLASPAPGGPSIGTDGGRNDH